MQSFSTHLGYRQCPTRTARWTSRAGHGLLNKGSSARPYLIDDSLPGPGPSSLAAAVAAPSATSNNSSGAGLSAGGRGSGGSQRSNSRRQPQQPKKAAPGVEEDGEGTGPTSILDVAQRSPSPGSDSDSEQRSAAARGSGRGAGAAGSARGRGGRTQQQQQQRQPGASGPSSPGASPGVRQFRGAAAGAAVAVGTAQAARRSQTTNQTVGGRRGDDRDSRDSRSSGNNMGRREQQADGGNGAQEDDEAGTPPPRFLRLPDGRQVVPLRPDTAAAGAAGALSRALGVEGKAVVRFDGAAGGLKGLRVLTLAHVFMGAFGRGLSFVVDVRQAPASASASERPQAGDVSFGFRAMARSRPLEAHEARLGAALREARFVLDLSINVRQAWDCKGDIDEEQAYDLADTFYAALAAQQADEDAEDAAAAAAGGGRARQARQRSQAGGGDLPPPGVFVTADLAQGLTTFTALGLLQKRLREEGQNVVVESTMYRASSAAPRVDGRDGWIFALRLGRHGPYLAAPRENGQAATSVRSE
ncbi:hypothetical protein HXX76_012270 [Chlamydomonas incerta]|uniref:Uncharacterized protein n=1 Tax=Chlamydomonas incerta TaxID=51695 RepID=A0A835VVR6_CHLIN|nr:hypothetical protein HXX76_012270 [Chlamydomonas incerta]|eukprot:KAG2427618.1 hypothetical protein HXX76_012270 [Chlamydomonas incerta]